MTLILLILMAIGIYYIFVMKGYKKLKIGEGKVCHNCKNPVEDSFNVCPVCKETLRRKCVKCGELIDVHWAYCPYCETPQGRKNG